MIYFIERITPELPFDNSIAECQVGEKTYDVVVAPKDTGLNSISDHIVDDNQLGMTFFKTDPREQKIISEFIEERWGSMSELLLG
ncbi:MAG: hypothetical protein J7L15_07735 [Clostridiales bacterium]|nr:hypothetical protein [Clostridiales bacterium]